MGAEVVLGNIASGSLGTIQLGVTPPSRGGDLFADHWNYAADMVGQFRLQAI